MEIVLRICLVIAATAFACAGCEGAGEAREGSDADTDGDTDSDSDSDSDTDADTDADTDPGSYGTIQGVVLAPNGDFPVSGALVYVTSGDAVPIEDNAYCYECDDMTGKKWTLSGADGSWSITGAPAGTRNLVTRKGFFQRQREIEIVADTVTDIPAETTTLPSADGGEGLDVIPNYAVLLNTWDQQHNLLAKLGLGELDGSGNLLYGTEQFDIFNDDESTGTYAWSSALFADQGTLDHYHMVFFPCTSSYNGVAFVNNHATMLQAYVNAGGKMYSSCCTALWNVAPFPGYIDYYGDDSPDQFDIGRITSSAYSTTGETLDPEMAAWLEIVSVSDASSVPFNNGYVKIDGLNDVDDGHGLEDDGFWVKPKQWIVDNGSYPGSPLIVTYNWDCGKVFYSVYETSHDSGTAISPQEYVLLYVILEVGVCEGEYEEPE
ncbi:MAG: carboxypeptidase-like regulatory domain-containing protein [Proteobacteria bacterium]|nr:carboxypeptidase-like regulatory domain-containing protein [Pseudomonadota bacterium]